MNVVVPTPGGNIGRPLTERLLAAGARVAIVSRHPDRVAGHVQAGARLWEGSLDELEVLRQAFSGADALFWLTPPNLRRGFPDWARTAAARAADVLRGEGIARVVNVSSIGAQSGPGTGPVAVLGQVETVWSAACPNVTHLRPGFFMENVLSMLPQALEQGAIMLPVSPQRPFPMIATRDIAARAAELLLDRRWTGRRHLGLHGPEDLTFARVAEIMSEGLRTRIEYRQITGPQMRQALIAAGWPEYIVGMVVEMYEATEKGLVAPAEPRTPETTTPTTFAQFVQEVVRPAAERIGGR